MPNRWATQASRPSSRVLGIFKRAPDSFPNYRFIASRFELNFRQKFAIRAGEKSAGTPVMEINSYKYQMGDKAEG